MPQPALNPESLLCALIIAPHSFARNRFHSLFEDPVLRRVRGRAKRVRGIIRQLAQIGPERAEIVGQQELEDGRILLRYRISNLAFERTTSLSSLEAAAVSYALHKVGRGEYTAEDRKRVESALHQLGLQLPAP